MLSKCLFLILEFAGLLIPNWKDCFIKELVLPRKVNFFCKLQVNQAWRIISYEQRTPMSTSFSWHSLMPKKTVYETNGDERSGIDTVFC